ncbi:hypothetical protein BS78_10G121100 [Paspalum vaginatum]|nr:hypothetical protein BS78_10G121100 [Paspalum vaginatum]
MSHPIQVGSVLLPASQSSSVNGSPRPLAPPAPSLFSFFPRSDAVAGGYGARRMRRLGEVRRSISAPRRRATATPRGQAQPSTPLSQVTRRGTATRLGLGVRPPLSHAR